MFKNRKLVVKVEKMNDGETVETLVDPRNFERNADIVMRKLESLGAKMFLGICVYIILDTRRQVAVANAIYHQE